VEKRIRQTEGGVRDKREGAASDEGVHCNTLQHTAAHCSTLQHTATHCSTLQHIAAHYNTLQHTATHCSTLQHTATHCSTLQHTATHCNALEREKKGEPGLSCESMYISKCFIITSPMVNTTIFFIIQHFYSFFPGIML